MKITYIEHSGFLLETEDTCFLFDYYKGKIPQTDERKALVVFVSHRHGDHYNKEIFELVKKYPGVRFVLPRDIRTGHLTAEYKERGIDLESHILTVAKNAIQEMVLSNGRTVVIETLRSTDEGVAYFLSCEGRNFYHAGDLNLWVWEEESKQYNNNMKAAYYKELEKLRGRSIDVAFVPLDPRQGKDAFMGLKSFMEYTKSSLVFPMHFWGEYGIIEDFLKNFPQYRDKIAVIHRTGQEFFVK